VWCELLMAAQRGRALEAKIATMGIAQRASQMSCPYVPDVSISW
jgi:hypothetical protein